MDERRSQATDGGGAADTSLTLREGPTSPPQRAGTLAVRPRLPDLAGVRTRDKAARDVASTQHCGGDGVKTLSGKRAIHQAVKGSLGCP